MKRALLLATLMVSFGTAAQTSNPLCQSGILPDPGYGGPSVVCGSRGPQTVGDPVDIVYGSTFERFVDLEIGGTLQPLTFERYYTSNDFAWSYPNYTDLYNVPMPFGPVSTNGVNMRWFHNYYAFVTELYGGVGNPYPWWTVRAPGGALMFFDRCDASSAPCWATATDRNSSVRDRLLYDGSNFTLYRNNGTRLVYSAKHVANTNSISAGIVRRVFLTQIQNSTGQTVAMIAYAPPSVAGGCWPGDPGTDSGVPYISRVTGGEANSSRSTI